MKTICAILLLTAAIICTAKTRWVQLRKLGAILLQPFRHSEESSAGMSAFEAAATSLAATIGTGNIAGVAGAILLGGPGTIFWIWISGLLGMGLKYVEILMAMRYRKRGHDGQWRGGPMYFVRLGLPKRYQAIGLLFALCGMLAALGMGDLVQVSAVAESAEALYAAICGAEAVIPSNIIRLATGVITAGILFAVLSGGAKRIGRAAALLVPLMSFVYFALCLIVIVRFHTALPSVFKTILQSAFHPKAVLGTAAGIGLRETFRVGLSRGIFSHEAGLGTAAIAHSCAENKSAEDQARFGAFEVFFDVLICSLTAIMILVSGISLPFGNAEINSTLVIDALSSCFGSTASAAMMAASLLLFAFSSMTGFALYGGRCAEFLFGSGAERPYCVLFLLITIVGPLLPRSAAWEVAELLNAFLCVPNLAAMALLLYRDQKLGSMLKE